MGQRERVFAADERDYQLFDDDQQIRIPDGWGVDLVGGARVPFRQLPPPDAGPGCGLDEWMLAFPSAPIQATNRLVEHQLSVAKPQPKMHSYRVLRRARPDDALRRPPSSVFLLHHGLNEVDDLRFFYDFASNLLSQGDDDAMCIIRPFPGHLTRQPFSGPFNQTPLDRYLTDAGDLFRQFLRYMVETRWFLSVIAPLKNYNTVIGADLLCPVAEGGEGTGREDIGAVAQALRTEWDALRDASRWARRRHGIPLGPMSPRLEDDALIAHLSALRDLVGVDPQPLVHEERAEVREVIEQAEPRIHVVGYSLGGFVAQSVFFAWPYLIGGCETLLSGGALRDLTPTAFAHPEEWQTVLHALRYEVDESLMRGWIRQTRPGRSGTSPSTIVGLAPARFNLYVRLFYEVFEQEYHNAYQTRASEFSRRLLFVVGGSDEIVRTQSVMDAAPTDEGINLLQIANLSHFLGREARGVERSQREYWLPEIARMTYRFCEMADGVRRADLARAWLVDLMTPWDDVLVGVEVERARTRSEASLPSPHFEKALDRLVTSHRSVEGRHSLLVVAQNTIPAVLLSARGRRERASALHHSDDAVVSYLAGIQRRAEQIEGAEAQRHLAVVLPHAVGRWHARRGPNHPAKSETIPGLLGASPDRAQEWLDLLAQWRNRLLFFRPPQWDAQISSFGEDEPHFDHDLLTRAWQVWAGLDAEIGDVLPHPVSDLPNVWLRMSGSCLVDSREGLADARRIGARLIDTLYERRRKHPIEAAFQSDLAQLAAEGDIMCIRISPAHYNPRHRGRLVTSGKQLHQSLSFLALVLALCGGEPQPVQREAPPVPSVQ
jgi:hypothetical protein